MPFPSLGALPDPGDEPTSPALAGGFFNAEPPAKQSICPPMQEMQVQSLGWEDPLEKEMVTHSSILAWRIPRTEEPEELQSMGSQSQI